MAEKLKERGQEIKRLLLALRASEQKGNERVVVDVLEGLDRPCGAVLDILEDLELRGGMQ